MSKTVIETATVKLALAALEKMARLTGPRWALESRYAGHLEAITHLQAMLKLAEQPAQEPVAWMYDWICDGELIEGWIAHKESEIPRSLASNIRPLYTTPQAQQPLTEPEFEALYCKAKGYVQTGLMDVVRLVENHHNIKVNT